MDVKVARLHRLNNGNMRAFVDITVNDELLIKGLRIVQGKFGPFVSMPREKGQDGKWYEQVQPLSKEVKKKLDEVILKIYAQGDKNEERS